MQIFDDLKEWAGIYIYFFKIDDGSSFTIDSFNYIRLMIFEKIYIYSKCQHTVRERENEENNLQ